MKKEIGRRHYQIGERIRRELSRLFREGRFEHKVSALFSIAEVRMSKGFETATVFISALDAGGDEGLVSALNGIAGEVRYELAAAASLRTAPALVFKSDAAPGYAGRIEELLNSDEVKKDLA
ncbi:MAG: 30S ribosome-binding factor RbfA [Rickettsiales bacterium]|jgi:ribosome-binding factor A|nr:30S ribosome-binding factor RbfA [Rickettsiales bacterium]